MTRRPVAGQQATGTEEDGTLSVSNPYHLSLKQDTQSQL